MKSILTLLTTLLIVSNIIAQSDIEWEKSFGGTSDDRAYSIQQTTDGGFIVAGFTKSSDGDVTVFEGASDIWVIKIDASGSLEWEKSFGGSGFEEARQIQQTTDGGYILIGQSNSDDFIGNTNNYDIVILKLDSSGDLQWAKSFGGNSYDRGRSIKQTSDGGYIASGMIYSATWKNMWVVKLDSLGNISSTWVNTLFGGTNFERANSVIQTTDGGYIAAGYTQSNDYDVTNNNGASDFWVVKINTSGTIQWEKTFGGTSTEGAQSIQQTLDGGYIVAGYTQSNDGDVTNNNGNQDFWVVKLDTSGNIQWEKTFGGTSSEMAQSIQQTLDGGYIVAGYTQSNNGDVNGNHNAGFEDYWVVKLNALGSIIWQKCLGGTDSDIAQSIQQTTDGGYVVAGYSNSDNGDILNELGSFDFWIVKLEAESLEVNDFNDTTELISYPNPVKDILYIKNIDHQTSTKVYNSLGQFILETNKKEIDFSNFNRGVYFVEITTKQRVQTKKIIKE